MSVAPSTTGVATTGSATTGAGPIPAIEVLSAQKTYPNGVVALQPVDLTILEGELVT